MLPPLCPAQTELQLKIKQASDGNNSESLQDLSMRYPL